eukprot:m.71217 g.71217  ORF g.71217 m.71217 type:complete len:436 (-) comp11701_c0_seq7:784-2091(-)
MNLVFVFVLVGVVCAGAPPGPEKVYNDAGYIDIENSFGTAHLFYWFFESRNDPTNDPFVMWMSGGPGCSSQLALFGENGPYIVQEDLNLTLNPHSWNNNATVLWIDQPVGTGFSYGDPPVVDEAQVANDVWNFLVGFFKKYPKYSNLPFIVTGESYAGHYVPAVSAKIVQELKNGATVPNYQGSAIGNGLTDPFIQFQSYIDYVRMYNGTTALNIKEADFLIMESFLPLCELLTGGCNLVNMTIEEWELCFESYVMCSYTELLPVQASHINVYDVREKCHPDLPLCYNFTLIDEYLNQPAVKKALGVDGREWSECNRVVDLVLAYAGDWMVDYNSSVAYVLDEGYKFMIYAGEYDFICNWLGNKAWTQSLDWTFKNAYVNAPNKTWHIDGDVAFYSQSAHNFSFVKVTNAGHMVPRDQPKNSLEMLNRFLFGSWQ